MDRRFQQSDAVDRSRYGGGFARRAIGRGHLEGNGEFTNPARISKIAAGSIRRNVSPLERHLLVSESWQHSSKKTSGRPFKVLIHEEMSREKKASQSSPSIIAKLMGLDSLPPPQMAPKRQKETRSCVMESPYASLKDHSTRKISNEHQEFKDVFEIKDSIEFEEHKKRKVLKGNSHLKPEDTDVAFIREKFMEAKRLSADGILQNSKEFNDAIEVLDSNKDLLLKFLEEPSSWFTKHLHDSNGFSPAPHERHITVLKSSKGKMSEIDEALAKSEVKKERRTKTQKESIGSLRKPTADLFRQPAKEHGGSLSHKLKSRYAGKSASLPSTRIVVLKPNLEKAQGMTRHVSQPRSHENYPFGYKRQWEIEHSAFHELHAEGRERPNLFDNAEVMERRTKGSREIAREIARQMKHSVSSGSNKMLASGFNRYEDGSSCGSPPLRLRDLNSSEAYQRSPEQFDCWNGFSRSSTCSIESPMSKEARKRLCERWTMANRKQEVRLVGGSTSTLGEMLAQSDEVPQGAVDPNTVQKVFDDKSTSGMLERQVYTSGISSRDFWKVERLSNSPRASSPPVLQNVYGTSKPSRHRIRDGDSCYMLKDVLNLGVDESFGRNLNQRRSPSRKSFKFQNHNTHLNPSGEENKLPVKEIHVNQEELNSGVHVSNHSEVTHVFSELGNNNISTSGSNTDSPLVLESTNEEVPPVISERHYQESAQNTLSSRINQINEVVEEISSPDNPQVDSDPSPFCGTGSESLISCKDAEQPSPASVLDHQSEGDESSPECFERVSADLQGLRMQLQLLRLESDQYTTECNTPVLSEDGIGECNSPSSKAEILQIYRDDEDRDCSYVHDILTESKHGVELDVFEKLEKKYGVLVEWSKSDRKLFFDLVSSVLSEALSPSTKTGVLVEGVWRTVVTLQKEVKQEERILDPRWLDLRDDIDVIGKDIEEMLKDELMEELVSEFILN